MDNHLGVRGDGLEKFPDGESSNLYRSDCRADDESRLAGFSPTKMLQAWAACRIA